jgi:hypothetical protein
MRKIVLLLLTSLLIFSCDLLGKSDDDENDDAYIRYQNLMTGSGADLHYGIRVGYAEHIGQLSSGSVTGYYATSEGSYSLQLLNSEGYWITMTYSAKTVEADKYYTCLFEGNTDDNDVVIRLILDR